MTYAKRKAQLIRLQLLAEAGCPLATTGKKTDPWPILKAKMDKAFSDLVRMTHADDNGVVTCITCEKTGYWKSFDNGHFVTRDHLPTRWDADNCRPQCGYDNRQKSGLPYPFGQALNRQLGPGTAERLIKKGDEPDALFRFAAPDIFLTIKAQLKIQRKRFR